MIERRISLFSATLGGGGAERVMATLANGFNRAGFTVDVVLVKQTGSYVNELDPEINVVDLASNRALYSLIPLIQYLRQARPDAMLATMGHVNIIAILARMISRVPMRLFVREAITVSVSSRNSENLKDKFIRHILKNFYAIPDGVIAPSQGIADDLIKAVGFPKDRIVVIANPLDMETIQELSIAPVNHPWVNSDTVPLILGVGRLTAQKDFQTLIRAFDKVLKVHHARLAILGEGVDRKALEELIKSMGLEGIVAMPGYVENPFAYMKQAAVYVLSSRWEGLPNALLQAAAVGTHVVATDCPSGPKEILEQGRWGKLVPVGDVEAMARAIIDALEGRLEKLPFSLLEERYGIEPITKKYLDVLTAAQPVEQNNTTQIGKPFEDSPHYYRS
ncbi:MAG: glycosyltransferase [Deltaproteobacteria bacterium]|nr:glycosyltransferase [Deltaproteobacteria bacterium]